jgi:hypothetical protein
MSEGNNTHDRRLYAHIRLGHGRPALTNFYKSDVIHLEIHWAVTSRENKEDKGVLFQ